MNLNDYFNPVSLDKPSSGYLSRKVEFGRNISIHTPSEPITEISRFKIAILGVPDDRNSLNKGCSGAPDRIRQHLYRLHRFNKTLPIIDLGNLKTGPKPEDSYYGLQTVVSELLSGGIVPVVIGGGQDLTIGMILAFEKLNRVINLVSIDSRIDLNSKIKKLSSETYLQNILNQKTRFLFNYTNIGHQVCFTDRDDLELLKNLYYETVRLGEARLDLKQMEPVLRDADMVSFDICAIKNSDAPGHYHPSPNGFYSEEACQLSRYCGLSDQLSVFFISEVNPEHDVNALTAHLAAEIIWYFIDGFMQRRSEKPDTSENFTKFIVAIDSIIQDLVFYKSEQSNRWWIEIPRLPGKKGKPFLISCSYEDYLMAGRQEIPDRWWKAYQKIN